ncbi:MAG: response regulator [Planctomycetes bacterium]|nr:response regulator [Planctomycetota bacterium]
MANKKRALIIDDEWIMRRLLDDCLRETHECSIVCNGKEGFRLASEHGMYDIITMDLAMPGWDGISSLALIDTMNPEAKIIVLSGFISAEDMEQLESFNCVKGVLDKPFNQKAFLDLVVALENEDR